MAAMRALITRPKEDASAIAADLAALGVDSLIEPLLVIEPVAGKTVDLTGVQAVLVTSRHGVRALAQATSAQAAAARDLPILTVGEATADLARDLGFAKVESATGDSRALARLAIDRLDPKAGPLVHAAGRDVAGDLAAPLAAAGFTLRPEILYAARAIDHLSPETLAALDAGSLDMVLLFSPRTARSFVKLVEEAGVARGIINSVALCLSDAVAEAAESLPWQDVMVATRPDRAALLALVYEVLAGGQGVNNRDRTQSMNASGTLADDATAMSRPPRDRRGARALASLALLLGLGVAASGAYLWINEIRPAIERIQPPAPSGEPALISQLAARLAQLEARPAHDPAHIATLEERVGRLAALDERVGRLGEDIAALASRTGGANAGPDLAQRFDRLARQSEALANRVTSIEATERPGVAAAPPPTPPDDARLGELVRELEALKAETAALQQALSNQVRHLAKLEALPAPKPAPLPEQTIPAAFALAIGQLRAATRGGEPFTAALAAMRRVAGQDSDALAALAPLGPLADKGVPSTATLARRFPALAGKAVQAAGARPPADWIEAAWQRVSHLVRIRPVGYDVAGEGADAVIARAEIAVVADNFAQAVATLARLQGPAADTLAGWLGDARARLGVEESLDKLDRLATQRLAETEGRR